MSERPEGHITILFTDMEGSSTISRNVGAEVYRERLREPHNRVIREAIAAHGGFEIGTPAGDSFMAVFHMSEPAIRCARQIQTALHERPIAVQTSEGREYGVRVRVGVHTAEEPLRLSEEGEYVGADVALAKRVESLGVGGQVLVSGSSYRSCEASRTYAWQRWPNRKLKGFDRLETVWELLWDGRSRGEPGASSRDLHQQARLHEEQGRWTEAEQCYVESLEVMREYGDRTGECRTLNNLACVRLRQRLFPEAEEALRSCVDLARELGDQGTEARALMNLGLCHGMQRRREEAERYYTRSIRVRERIGDRGGMALCMRYLGVLLEEHGEAAEAERWLKDSLETSEERADPRGQAHAHKALGRLHHARGSDEAAETHYRKALELFVSLGDRVQEAQILSNLGVLNQKQHQNSRAERFHRSSLNLLKDAGEEGLALRARINFATYLLTMGESGAARKVLEECFEASRHGRDDAAYGATMANLALLFDSGGEWAAAVNVARKALAALEKAGQPHLCRTVESWLHEWGATAPTSAPEERLHH